MFNVMTTRFQFSIFVLSGIAACLPPAASAQAPIALNQLVADVLASHPETRLYEAEIEAAQAGHRGSGAWADPEVSFDIGRKRVSGPAGMVEGEGTAWAVSLSQTFEWPGRVSLRKAIAEKDLEMAKLGLEQFKTALEARVRFLAFGLSSANERAGAALEVADRIRALRDVLLAREPAGIAPLLEIRAIESAELVLQRHATDAVLAVNEAVVELNQLRGAPLDSAITLEPIDLRFNEPPTPTAIAVQAANQNFALRFRLLELEKQESIESLARSDRYPAFTVSPFYSEESALEQEKTFGVGFSLPLPISGERAANVDKSSARRAQAAAAVAAEKLTFERSVVLATNAYSARRAEIERWSPQAITRFREAAEQADHHFRQGAVPLSTYIELQKAYLNAMDTLIETRRDALEAALELERLTGNQLQLVEVKQ